MPFLTSAEIRPGDRYVTDDGNGCRPIAAVIPVRGGVVFVFADGDVEHVVTDDPAAPITRFHVLSAGVSKADDARALSAQLAEAIDARPSADLARDLEILDLAGINDAAARLLGDLITVTLCDRHPAVAAAFDAWIDDLESEQTAGAVVSAAARLAAGMEA
jgi:hypothetical protein